jgi:SAM-dependent methyltransferase
MYIALQRLLRADRARHLCLDGFLKLHAGERVLDIGCGPGHVLDYLPRVQYVGFDTEPRYINYAQQHYSDRGRFFCEEFTHAHVERFAPFDAIILFGIIHHIDDLIADNLLCLLAECLSSSGRMVTLDPCIVPGQGRISRLVAQWDRGRYVRDREGYQNLVGKHFSEVAHSVIPNTSRIPSTELIMHLRRQVN